jgi:hypothetical protein
MESLVHVAKVCAIDMSVDLGGRDIRMPEHLLYGGEVRTTLEEVRSEAMSQRMRRDAFPDASPLYVLAEDLPNAHARERFSMRVEKHDAFAGSVRQTRSQLAQVDVKRALRASANRNNALLGAFAEDGRHAFREIHVPHFECCQLTYSYA